MPRYHPSILATAPGLVATAVFVVLLTVEDRTAQAYIDIPVPSLAELCKGGQRGTESIAVLRIEKVNRRKRGIVYSKVRDLKGSFPAYGKYYGKTFTHVIRESPNDWLLLKPHNYMDPDRLEQQNQAILAWAMEGKQAVIFQRDGEHAICVGHLWYTARPAVSGGRPGPDLPYKSNREKPPEKEPWVYGGASDPRFARFFCGDVDELIAAVTAVLDGKKDAIVPRMVGSEKSVSDRTGPVLRLRADREEFGDRGSFTPDARPKQAYYDPYADQAMWATHRGNAQRTGTDDGLGPKKPKILWVHKSANDFIAPLVPGARDLYASSLAAFNTPWLQAFCPRSPWETNRSVGRKVYHCSGNPSLERRPFFGGMQRCWSSAMVSTPPMNRRFAVCVPQTGFPCGSFRAPATWSTSKARQRLPPANSTLAAATRGLSASNRERLPSKARSRTFPPCRPPWRNVGRNCLPGMKSRRKRTPSSRCRPTCPCCPERRPGASGSKVWTGCMWMRPLRWSPIACLPPRPTWTTSKSANERSSASRPAMARSCGRRRSS